MNRFKVLFLLSSLVMTGCKALPSFQEAELSKSEALPTEKHRPLYHFTPPEKWMNDPNGMVYHDGEYHLFYQHHPDSTVWGPMHWGHAISTDMLNWQHMPIAIYPDENGTIFSGSAVVDINNTSGFGTLENPAMIAIFSYHNAPREQAGFDDFQTQGIAYSLDNGRTWTKYANNPVLLNPGIKVFRDPKVMWHEPQQKWVMSLAQGDHIGFYSSKNLIDWTAESTFGAGFGEQGGVWECPDLIKVKVKGSDTMKDVLLVSIVPGGPNGGSATQYFVGDFNGSEFILDESFAPQVQHSPAFFPEGDVFANFEGDFGKWQEEGSAFGSKPITGNYPGQHGVSGFVQKSLANSYYQGDTTIGKLTSSEFAINRPYINFYIGGGSYPKTTAMNLLVDGKIVRTASGRDSESMYIESWDVSEFVGTSATLEIVDSETQGWGHVLVDHIVFSDTPAYARKEPAKWLDYGTDNYAGVTFSNVPETDGRLLFMGWMSNWLYANYMPTDSWRGAMTVPRELTLHDSPTGYKVFSNPIKELGTIVSANNTLGAIDVEKHLVLTEMKAADSGSTRLQMDVEIGKSDKFQVVYSNSLGDNVAITLNVSTGQVELDRTESGDIEFNRHFASKQQAPVTANLQKYNFDIFYDQSSIEVFLNEGELVMSALVFPDTPYTKIEILSDRGVQLQSVSLDELKSEFKLND